MPANSANGRECFSTILGIAIMYDLLSRLLVATLFAVIAATSLQSEEKDSVDRDYEKELPRVEPVEPDDALATIRLADGFRLELVAHEPLVVDPIAMAFDEDGRLFVIEMRGYSEQGGENLGRVRLLTDTDGDGKFDKASVYADGLSWPTAVCCWDGGVFVAAAPDVWYFKDTDGDGEADKKEKVFTGFGRGNVQGLVNTLLWGPDNRIHGATSSSGATIRGRESFSSPPDASRQTDADARKETPAPLVLRGRDFSFDPRTLDLRAESGGGQHGMSFNDWGEKFVSSNSDHLQMVMFEDRYVARNPYWKTSSPRISIAADGPQADVFRISPVEPWRIVRTRLRTSGIVPGPVERGGKAAGYFTGATGVTICRGDIFPPLGKGGARGGPLRGYAIVGDVGSNLIHRKRLDRDGVRYIGRRVDEKSELIASTDIWFRPVQFANGPDGALYIADMYREVIEHPKSLPPVIKKHLDLTSGRNRGRIYRLVPEKFEQPRVPKMSKYSTQQLVAALDHPNAWHRDTAARLLYERQDRAAASALVEFVGGSAQTPQGRIAALVALDELGALSLPALSPALVDADPHVRRQAVRLSERLAADSPAVRDKLCGMVDDEDLGVRYQLAFTLGEFRGPRRDEALADLLVNNAKDSCIRLAVGTSLHEGSGAVLEKLVAPDAFVASPQGLATIRDIAAQIGRQQRPEDVAAVIATLSILADVKDVDISAAILTGLAAKEGSDLRAKVDAASKGRAGKQIEKLVAAATARALDDSQLADHRTAAIAQMRLGSFTELQTKFDDLLAPEQPVAVQAAALDALATFDAPEVAHLLIARWSTFTPASRRRAGDVLFSRQRWIASLLDALEAKKIPLGEIQREHFYRIDTRRDSPLAGRFSRLLTQLQTASPRAEIVEKYQAALEVDGNPERGRVTFVKNCAACHKVGDVGHEIGPNLAAMRNRGAEAILVNVLDPNREVNPQYVNYVAITKEGRSLSGMITAETAGGITLVRGEGAKDSLLRVDLDELKSTGVSLMPEGLEKQIDQQTMADLLAYLLTTE